MSFIQILSLITIVVFTFPSFYCNLHTCQCFDDESSEIECTSKFDNIRIECPNNKNINDNFVIEITNDEMSIKCPNVLKKFKINKLPQVILDRVSKIHIKYCSFQIYNFTEIFNYFSIQKIEYFQFDSTKTSQVMLKKMPFLTDLKDLIMTDNKIKKLDPNIFLKNSKLRKLDLQNNNVTLINNLFKNLHSLQILDLSWNNLVSLPTGIFSSLKSLRILHLWQNKLNKIDDFTFADLVNLKSLELSHNFLNNISELSFIKLRNLIQINLSNNCLKIIPETLFSQNKKLKLILLRNNAGLQLPNLIFANLFLVKVDLGNCFLNNIPKDCFKNTTTLKIIRLEMNELQAIPDGLFDGLINLERIYLGYNKIKSISNLFNGLKQLKVLNLGNNRIQEFSPEDFGDLHNLEKLYLNNNRIKRIYPNSFYKNNQLKIIILRNNFIENTVISSEINNFRYWDFSHNKISEFKIENWQNLSLNLNYNQISRLHLNDTHLKYNLKISLNNNPIICDCFNYNLLKYFKNHTKYNLKIHLGNASCSDPQKFKNMIFQNLELFDLTCPLREVLKVCDSAWRPFDKTVFIDCSNNSLTKFPQINFWNFKSVDYTEIKINLERNELKTGPESYFVNYTNITALNLSYNKIARISWLPPNLKELQLDHNKITKLSPDVIQSLNKTNLVNLTLNNNPWLCECGTEILSEFLRQTTIDVTNVHCSNLNTRLIDLTRKDLCKNWKCYLPTIALSIFLTIALSLTLYYRHKQTIKNWLFSKNLCLCWLPDKEKKYDVFISYSHKDEILAHQILMFLESGSKPFKTCIHYRDWIPGEPIVSQITNSVLESSRTLIILSRNFLQSVWGKIEFRTAHTQAMRNNREMRVVVVLYEDVEIERLDEDLKVYLKTNTFIKWGDKYFWEKLKNALPHKIRNKTQMEDESLLLTLSNPE